MDSSILQIALQAVQNDQRYAFATVVESTQKGTPQKAGAKMLVLEDGSLYGTIGGGRYEKSAQEECLKAIQSGKSKLVTYDYFGKKGQSICGGQIKVFIEPSPRKTKLIICGGGHIGLQLSFLGKVLNYQVTLIDNRKDFACKKRFSHVDKVVYGEYLSRINAQKIDQNTAIVIVTQGNEFDFKCLKTVIESKAGYIGCISSHTKKVKFIERLRKAKVSQERINRVKIPAGIDLGGQTPAEISVSIASEIIQTMNQAYLGRTKFKNK